jgi:hypothetical protein
MASNTSKTRVKRKNKIHNIGKDRKRKLRTLGSTKSYKKFFEIIFLMGLRMISLEIIFSDCKISKIDFKL